GGKSEVIPLGKSQLAVSPLPSPATPPTVLEMRALIQKAKSLPSTPAPATYLGEDWQTQGDWVGRYGIQKATLCAMAAPIDHYLGWSADIPIKGSLGGHHARGDSLRRWVHWRQTNDHRSLYDPVVGYRRQAEWDDHGEEYPMSFEGPDMWASVEVPRGVFALSLYFMNKDGHDGMNRCRDYLVEVKRQTARVELLDTAPTLARCRVRDFWGGVYKTFIVQGPATYAVKIARNDSFNTICSAVMVTQLVGRNPD